MSESTQSMSVKCPSAQPDWEGSVAFGVIGGTVEAPQVNYLAKPEPVTDDLLAMAKPANPGEVFRFSAPCACAGCSHFAEENSKCRLAEKVVNWVPAVISTLPVCAIRAECRWWLQEGQSACHRCPQVVSLDTLPSEAMRNAADPTVLLHE